MTKAKPKFVPIGEVLSPETAFIQASNILDLAAEMAFESRDVEGLSRIASVYMEMGSRLMVIEDGPSEEEVEDECANRQPIGFSPVLVPVKEVEGKDE